MKELLDYLELRSGIYNTLGKAFYKEPTAAYLEELKKYTEVFGAINENNPNEDIEEGLAALKEFYASVENIEQAVDDLECEFASIFLSTAMLSGQKSVIPQESVYLSSGGLAMQEQRDEVLEIYYNEKVGRQDNFKEPEDHISAEMGFMALLSSEAAGYLSNGESDKAETNMKLQQSFLNSHILSWAPKMCIDLRAVGSAYYRGIASLTAGFLSNDSVVLKEILED